SKDFTITARPITVTADAGQSKVYGAADPTAYSYAITAGALQGSDVFSGALSRLSGDNVGSYAITQGTLSAGSNYELSFVSKDFTNPKRAVQGNGEAGQGKVHGA